MTCYQLVFQGIQSFHNHLPTSVGNCASDKVKSLMDNALTICQIHIDAFEIAEDDDTNECSEYVFVSDFTSTCTGTKPQNVSSIPKIGKFIRERYIYFLDSILAFDSYEINLIF